MLHLNTPTSSLRGIVVALSVLMSSQAQALQLGQPVLQSQLGQPLKLEVQISDLNAQEAQDFQAVLADETGVAGGGGVCEGSANFSAKCEQRRPQTDRLGF